MGMLITTISSQTEYLSLLVDRFKSMSITNIDCIKKLVSLSGSTDQYNTVCVIAENISNLSYEVHRYLVEELESDNNLQTRFVILLSLYNSMLARPEGKIYYQWVETLFRVALDKNSAGFLISSETNRPENIQGRAVKLILGVLSKSPLTLKLLFRELRDSARPSLQSAIQSIFPKIQSDTAEDLADNLLSGDIDQFETAALKLVLSSQSKTSEISKICSAMREGSEALMASDADFSTGIQLLVQTVSDHRSRILPLLNAITEGYAKTDSSDYWVNVIGILLLSFRPITNSYQPFRYLDSGYKPYGFLPLTRLLTKVLSLLQERDHQEADRLIENALSTEEFFNLPHRILAIRAIGCKERVTHEEIKHLKNALEKFNSDTGPEAEKALFRLSWLDREGVELVLSMIVPQDSNKYNSTLLDDLVSNPKPVSPSGIQKLMEALENWESVENDIYASYLVEYCLLYLSKNSAITEPVREICKKLMTIRLRDTNTFTRHDRALAILTLAGSGYCTEEFIEFLTDKLNFQNKAFRVVFDTDYEELPLASAVALTEIGSDISNELEWPQRKKITDALVKAAKRPWAFDTTYIGSYKNWSLPKSLNDAIYQSLKKMYSIFLDHECQTATNEIDGLA
jgi:hypothetical protein